MSPYLQTRAPTGLKALSFTLKYRKVMFVVRSRSEDVAVVRLLEVGGMAEFNLATTGKTVFAHCYQEYQPVMDAPSYVMIASGKEKVSQAGRSLRWTVYSIVQVLKCETANVLLFKLQRSPVIGLLILCASTGLVLCSNMETGHRRLCQTYGQKSKHGRRFENNKNTPAKHVSGSGPV